MIKLTAKLTGLVCGATIKVAKELPGNIAKAAQETKASFVSGMVEAQLSKEVKAEMKKVRAEIKAAQVTGTTQEVEKVKDDAVTNPD